MKKFIYSFLFLILFLASTATYFLAQVLKYKNPSDVEFEIKKNESFKSICSRLEKDKIISSYLVFRFYAKLKDDSQNIKYGKHAIKKGFNLMQVYDILKESTLKDLISVTIPEGYTKTKIENTLLKKHLIDSVNEFELEIKNKKIIEKYNIPSDSLEGFLYPDTYFFTSDFSIKNIILTMVDNFFKKIEQVVDYKKIPKDEFYKKLILASIVQGEYVLKKEAPIIASVFLNRLKKNQRLQSCATVVYVITEEKKLPHPKRILFKDLKIDSKYNTYYYSGLPPSPISNPGLVALKSVFHPAKTDYLFFALKPSLKEHEFSKDYSEHLKAREFYVKQSF